MEAKLDILQECKLKFLHTFQVRFMTQKLGRKDYICFLLSDFVRILATGTTCELHDSSTVFTSDVRQYCFFLLDQYSLLLKEQTYR